MRTPSTFNPVVIRDRLTADRLRSFLDDCDNDLEQALALYAWNARIASAFLEDLGRLEVVIRNRFDEALTMHTALAGLPPPWFDHESLFPGRQGKRTLDDIAKAKIRATRNGKLLMVQSRVIVELGLGFWRFLCSARHHTAMWVPVLAAQFPEHPMSGNAVRIRADVESRMAQLHSLRNRVAHHEPIHRRVLTDEAVSILELAGWMCADTHAWMVELSRVPAVLAARPT